MHTRCSLCGMLFDDADELIQQRKRRHEQWHRMDATSYRRNSIIGDVVWIDGDINNGTTYQKR